MIIRIVFINIFFFIYPFIAAAKNDGIAIMGMIPADRYERIQGIKNGTVTIIRDTVEVEREGILKKAVNKVKDKIEERKDAKDNI